MPDWNQINNEYNGMNVLEDALIGTITDDNVGLSECSKDVGGFPTIKLFDHGKETPYGGHMDKDSFDKLVKKTFKFASVGGGEVCKKGNYKPGFLKKRKMKKSRRKYLPGLNAGKKRRTRRKKRRRKRRKKTRKKRKRKKTRKNN